MINIKDGLLFKVKCTESVDRRFIVGQIYNLYAENHNGWVRIFTDDFVDLCDYSYIENELIGKDIYYIFKAWYESCRWTNYDFELVPDNEYEIEIL